MYIYHALINALSAHMVHINLNTIFYTHIEHSPTKTIYIRYMEKHKHIHNDCSRNWVLILVGVEEKRKIFILSLKDDGVEQCLGSFTHTHIHTHTHTHYYKESNTTLQHVCSLKSGKAN